MFAVDQFNEKWKEAYTKDRLRYVTNNPVFGEFLAEASLKDVFQLENTGGFDDWQAVITYKNQTISVNWYEDGEAEWKGPEELEDAHWDFVDDFVDFLMKLDIEHIISQAAEDRVERNSRYAETDHVGQTIVSVTADKEERTLTYTLSNGKTITVHD